MSDPGTSGTDPGIVKLLFAAAESFMDPGDRERFLVHACRGDAKLLGRLRAQLALCDRANEFFEPESEFVSAAPADEGEGGREDLGARVGRYQLVERIGSGGHGTVYLAEQLEPVRREVALKIVRIGTSGGNVVERFEMERQALALMDHPGIARVLDAGTTESGRPFFVMQLVKGDAITRFCDGERLSISERLALFMKVCRAVRHAHQKGMIHRDLKPSNILVTRQDGVPSPKVIDFGISKAMMGALPPAAAADETVRPLGTPNYASPEQVLEPADVDTRADVYSLGVILCELLVGTVPFRAGDAGGGSTEVMRRAVAAREIIAPSAILQQAEVAEQNTIAGNRVTEPARLASALRGDLDAIVLKCVNKDRANRYGSAEELASDLERHLAHEPVAARSGTRRYLFFKLLRRNRSAFIAAALVFAALAAGLGTATHLYLREKRALGEQRRLRVAAEVATRSETRLRERSDAANVCAQAAVELSHGNLEAADDLITTVPIHLLPPTLAVAESFVELGDWHRGAFRWQLAAERYLTAATAWSAADSSDSSLVSFCFVPAAGAACAARDWEKYGKLRELAIARFVESGDPVVSEQILKAVLIRPIGDAELARLEPMARTLETRMQHPPRGTPHERYMSSWACFSLALWEYRSGDLGNAERWVGLSERIDTSSSSRVAIQRILRAMIREANGSHDEAVELLETAGPSVRKELAGNINRYTGIPVYWLDWPLAGTLLEEAEALVGRD